MKCNLISSEGEELIKNEIMKIIREAVKETIKQAFDSVASKKEEKLTLTVDDAARLSGIGRDKILELVHNENSDFPCFKNGSKFLINRDKLIEWLNKVTQEKRTI